MFDGHVVWMSPESAEMSKHALNGYLALMVRYGNEIGRLCELWDADPLDVIAALRSEPRVSSSAPLLPGDPPSKHLMREVHTLIDLGAGPVIRSLA
jgi:UDP-N-acetyl-D-mannosaminuronate dehydrogenase